MSDSTISSPIALKHTQSEAIKWPRTCDRCKEGTRTPYMIMSLEANEMAAKYNILAAICSWLTLAGYVVVPATFTSLKNSESLGNSKGGKVVQDTVQNIPLLPLAGLSCLIGMIGMYLLWRKWRRNYVWLNREIFSPGLTHSVVGLLTTIINVTTAHNNHWSLTAIITVVINGIFTGTMSGLYLLYLCFQENIKIPEDRELAILVKLKE